MSDHTALRHLLVAGTAARLSCERALAADESEHLESILRRLSVGREVWRWKQSEDRQIIDLIKRRKRLGRPKPFQKNDEVRLLAEKLGRTYMAVHRRMERLRKKCSDAQSRRKG